MDQVVALVTLLVVAGSVLFDWWYYSYLPSKRLPPGPTPWPFVGSLPQLRRYGYDVLAGSVELAPKYGKIITYWLGKRPLIIVNDPELAHEALVKRGSLFADRAKLSSIETMTKGFRTISSSDGTYMTITKRNLVTNVLNSTSLKAFKDKRDATIDEMVRQVGSAIPRNEAPRELKILPIVRSTFFRYNLFMIFGVELDSKLIQRIDDLMQERILAAFRFYLGDYIPLWKIFETSKREVCNRNTRDLEALLLPIFREFRDREGSSQSAIAGNYLRALFDLQEKKSDDVYLDDHIIASLIFEFINASVHTISAAVDSALNILADNPEVQRKIFNEIETTVGKRTVDEADLKNLPYLEAVVKEMLRLKPPGPSTISHAAVEHCKLGGYDIPTNAVIYFHINAFHHDPNMWGNPWEFKPERFLEKEVDVLGTRDVGLIPFGAGRRICPASALAMIELTMITARMVQNFEWTRAKNESSGRKARHPFHKQLHIGALTNDLKLPLLARSR